MPPVPSYDEFVKAHAGLLRSMVRRASKGCPRHLTEDLEQAAAIGVVRALRALTAEGGDPNDEEVCRRVSSVVATELNVLARPARRQGACEVSFEVHVDPDALVDAETPESVLHGLRVRDLLEEAVRSLPSEERVVASLRFLRDPPLTYAALAEEMGLTVAAVRYREEQAVKALSALLVESHQ